MSVINFKIIIIIIIIIIIYFMGNRSKAKENLQYHFSTAELIFLKIGLKKKTISN